MTSVSEKDLLEGVYSLDTEPDFREGRRRTRERSIRKYPEKELFTKVGIKTEVWAKGLICLTGTIEVYGRTFYSSDLKSGPFYFAIVVTKQFFFPKFKSKKPVPSSPVDFDLFHWARK